MLKSEREFTELMKVNDSKKVTIFVDNWLTMKGLLCYLNDYKIFVDEEKMQATHPFYFGLANEEVDITIPLQLLTTLIVEKYKTIPEEKSEDVVFDRYENEFYKLTIYPSHGRKHFMGTIQFKN